MTIMRIENRLSFKKGKPPKIHELPPSVCCRYLLLDGKRVKNTYILEEEGYESEFFPRYYGRLHGKWITWTPIHLPNDKNYWFDLKQAKYAIVKAFNEQPD